jgi:AraC-like DNA-binding protein
MLQISLFNVNDLTLLSLIIECSILLAIIALTQQNTYQQRLILFGFIASHIFYALDILTYWNISLNNILVNLSPNIFFIFGFASFVKGPLLLGYTLSILKPEYLTKKFILHFIPVSLYPLVVYFGYYQYDHAIKIEWVLAQNVVEHSQLFFAQKFLQDFSAWTYAVIAIFLVIKYGSKGEENVDSLKVVWLKFANFGFLAIWSLIVYIYVDSWFIRSHWTFFLGTLGNYGHFLLFNFLIIYALTHTGIFSDTTTDDSIRHPMFSRLPSDDIISETFTDKIKNKMLTEKIYLKKNITMERFAEELGISTRRLSTIINSQFNQNFFEFINTQRVEEAKRLLLAEPQMSIQEVMVQSGFKSKSAFNRFFLKLTEKTPSEFRKILS